MVQEVWRDIPGYEGIYQASTLGRIRTVDGKTTHSVRHGIRRWKSRILKGRGDFPITGKRVALWKDKKSKDWTVARLVALTFLGSPDEKMTVNHKDGNRMNNEICNLEWLTLADNIRHGFETGLYHSRKPVCLYCIDNGSVYEYRSMSEASRGIGRNCNYLSNALKRNNMVRDSEGKKYEAFVK